MDNQKVTLLVLLDLSAAFDLDYHTSRNHGAMMDEYWYVRLCQMHLYELPCNKLYCLIFETG